MKSLSIIALFFGASSATYAEVITPRAVGCDSDSGDCYILLDSDFQGTTCTSKNQLRMDPDKKGSASQYATALAAFMAGKKLEVGSSNCYKNLPAPSWLYVVND